MIPFLYREISMPWPPKSITSNPKEKQHSETKRNNPQCLPHAWHGGAFTIAGVIGQSPARDAQHESVMSECRSIYKAWMCGREDGAGAWKPDSVRGGEKQR